MDVQVSVSSSKTSVRVSPKKRNAKNKAASIRQDGEVTTGSRALAAQREAVLSNFDTEVRARRDLLEQQIAYTLADLRRSCDAQLASLPDVLASMTAGEFAEVYAYSIDAAVRGIIRKQTEISKAQEAPNERLERGILASAKKRKHAEALPTPLLPQEEMGSPMPSRPQKRVAPSAPDLPNHIARPPGQAISRKARQPNAAASQPGFVFRARTSAFANAGANIVPPKTPTSAEQRRKLRKQESIQAFSLNGSPLGLMDIEREEDEPAPAPSGDFTFAMPATIVAKWREQLAGVAMAPEDKAKLEKALADLCA